MHRFILPPAVAAVHASARRGLHHIMDDAGQKLRRARERLSLRVRDVELASQRIADKYHNLDFVVLINRVSEIENRGLVPSIYKLYSLCAIYRVDFVQALEWYGIPLAAVAVDSLFAEVSRTHTVGFRATADAEVTVPVTLDPGIDLRRTIYLSRVIQRWGKLPLLFLSTLDPQDQRYGFIGTDDWFMYPLLQPGTFVMIDESRKTVQNDGWTNEFDRPIYFLEHRQGYVCGWCNETGNRIVLTPHPASGEAPRIYSPSDIEIIGQVVGIAMRLDQGRRRRTRS